MSYCEIFRAGKHTDSSGNVKTWTDEDLDTIVAKFNEKKPGVPIVLGHPKDNSPAFGWIDDVKRVGNSLFAKFKDVCPEFKEWVNKGFYKNRSVSLYPDLTLRHVGFLGGMQPAVKGLPEFVFNEDESADIIEFSKISLTAFKFETLAEILQRLREMIIDKFDIETADKVISTFNLDALKQIEEKTAEELRDYCEQLINGKENHMPPENKKLTGTNPEADTVKEFSEQIAEKDQTIKKLQEEMEEINARSRKAEYDSFAENAAKEGYITPAEKSFVCDFQEVCYKTASFDFTEGEEKSTLKRFQDFIKSRKVVNFSETPDGAKPSDLSDPKAAAQKVREYMEKSKANGVVISEVDAYNALEKGQNNGQ